MTALPLANEAQLDGLPNALSAYHVCLALEQKATTPNDLMHARILGYLILHAPSSTAQSDVGRAIHACAGDKETLLALGRCFLLWFILPFKKSRERTPASSYHPSRPSFNRLKEELKKEVREAPKNHGEAKAQALKRDGYKCIVTGKYDVLAEGKEFTVYTRLAHIVPQLSHFNVADALKDSRKPDCAASVSAVLQRFGYDVEKVNGTRVHSLYNVMTLQVDVHDAFDHLELWFEKTDVANRYRVRTIRGIDTTIPHEVTFTSPDPDSLPLPCAQLLALHAACAKVAQFSGAGDHIDKLDRDEDDLGVLATDGSSFAILTHAIAKSMSHPVSAVS